MHTKLQNALEFTLRSALWLVSVAGGFYLMLRIRTTILIAVTRLYRGSPRSYQLGLIDKSSMIIIAIGLIVVVVIIEYYYTHAKTPADLIHRFVLVTGIQFLVLAVNDSLTQLAVGIEFRGTAGMVFFLAELILGGLLVSHTAWWPRVFHRQQSTASAK